MSCACDVVALRYDLTSGASGLTPDARIKEGTTSSSSLLLSSSPRLSPPFLYLEVSLRHTTLRESGTLPMLRTCSDQLF